MAKPAIWLKVDPKRSELMRGVRRNGTALEQEVALICTSLGMRFRKNVKNLPGTPDFANKSRKWALFAHGCFWHHHASCHLAKVPARNAKAWQTKLQGNRRRDARKIRDLKQLGYCVSVVWQCELKNSNRIIRRISNLTKARVV